MSLVLAVGCGLLVPWPSARGQATQSNPPEPRLPGAIETVPEWLKDAPFDVAKFLEMPPAADNAAPLYLEALFEFGKELAPIYPPDVRERAAAISERAARAASLTQKDPKIANVAEIDAVLAEYQEGFRKLDLAQKRSRCVFATGLDVDAPLPHSMVARQAARVLLMRAGRSLDRDDFDSAIGDIARILRLSRDLRPRGPTISQIVSIAMDSSATSHGVKLFLIDSKLKAEHCDRLIKILAQHETLAIDPFTEGIKADYLLSRWLLRTLSDRVQTTDDATRRLVETKLNESGLKAQLEKLQIAINLTPEQISALKSSNGTTLAKDRRFFDDQLTTLLAAKPRYVDRISQTRMIQEKLRRQQPSALFKILTPTYADFILSCSRDLVYLRATQCQLAVRRWQLTHKDPLPNLKEICEASNIELPTDPFSDLPLKLAVINGEPVIYSVGPDGVDDGGLKDSNMGLNPKGDLLFPLPKKK